MTENRLLKFLVQSSIIRKMYRAEVEPMSDNPPDRVPNTGLWKVVIYEGERFVRTDRDYITHSQAQRIADEINAKLGIKRKAKGAGEV